MTVTSDRLSVVVPCYNEEDVLEETHRRLVDVLSGIPGVEFEIIYVDDGSRDRTGGILRALCAGDPRMRILRLSRNFGHQIAVTAGVEHASGDAVVLIDADLQDPPELIATMVRRWREGAAVAYGVRTEREGEGPFKRWTAQGFYRVLNRLSETAIPMDAGDFRLMDRCVVDALCAMPERDRFVRGMVSWAGFRQVAVPYRRARRFAGESKYPLGKMLHFAVDGVTSFSAAPLTMAAYLGFGVSGLALLGIVYALVLRVFTDIWVTGWTAIFIAVLFVGGVQLISLGIIGQYVGRIYGEVKHRPLYVVQERIGFSELPPRTTVRGSLHDAPAVYDRRVVDERRPPDDARPRVAPSARWLDEHPS
jgi:dolichol-phosphate mannosyltransferase